ncbi:MAG TPA: outer membrane lipid asymmetry maintenance protein MlaD [Hyphomonadaceae bacterium]|jgi:phospholipid/cholesterol/gamma-HCH transport system substrate-binding protein|nr:outer membrane lipid asymmetry maintenance protein MlaD [Hyphomonadaceae bacterium]
MRESLFETLVGLVVVAVAGIFLFFSLQQRSEAAPRNSYSLSAKFNKVDGISAGSDVRMAGVKVGTVTDIKLDPKSYKAVVSFTMRKGIQVPDDSTAQVVSDGLLGGAYIGIMVGGSFDYVAEGGQIEFTRGSVDLLTVLSEVAQSAAGGGAAGGSGGDKSEEEAPTK